MVEEGFLAQCEVVYTHRAVSEMSELKLPTRHTLVVPVGEIIQTGTVSPRELRLDRIAQWESCPD